MQIQLEKDFQRLSLTFGKELKWLRIGETVGEICKYLHI